MKSETKLLLGVLISCLVLVLGAVFLLGKGGSNNIDSIQALSIDYSKGEKIGSDSAKVRLVEFSDLQCPACKSAEPFVKQTVEKNKNNSFQFIYRHFPLTQHVHSRKAANFAEYANSQNKFWEIHDKLFATQDEWASLPDPTEYFANLGSGFGLDKDKIKEAISKSLFDQKINDDQSEGTRLGVDATPTFYLNGKKLRLQSFTELDSAVSKELQQNK